MLTALYAFSPIDLIPVHSRVGIDDLTVIAFTFLALFCLLKKDGSHEDPEP
ncbi:MAG: hypothetical protein ACLT8E_10300 [Akkermansia sp.]